VAQGISIKYLLPYAVVFIWEKQEEMIHVPAAVAKSLKNVIWEEKMK